jgi:hypothetical protein
LNRDAQKATLHAGMGVHVYLEVDEKRIEPDAWRKVYNESWRVLKAYPDVPLAAAYKEIAGERVIVYQREMTLRAFSRQLLTSGESWCEPEQCGRCRS